MEHELILSRSVYESMLAAAKKTERMHVSLSGIKVYQSPMFPYEISYPACNIETHEEIKVSGGYCHGVIIPPDTIDYPEPNIDFQVPLSDEIIQRRIARILGVHP